MRFLILFLCVPIGVWSAVTVGMDRLLTEECYSSLLHGKRVGLVTNHTAMNAQMKSSISLLKEKAGNYRLVALFAPEHGIDGQAYNSESVPDKKDRDAIPIYSLHGSTRRPTKQMLKGIDVLVFDMQDIGSRSYTYISTLFYVMEEAAKKNIHVIVTDRPNPLGGHLVDGPLLEEKWRSFLGYVNVPYCHGMTIGELALYFNGEYQIKCPLTVVPMRGWQRGMRFQETGLTWVPTSPQIPEADTSFFYPSTGIIGDLHLVNIGVGYTLPFKVIGAPWIDANQLASALNSRQYPGVYFHPFYYRPYFGDFKGMDCQGVRIVITDPSVYRPVTTQYLLLGTLKAMYPSAFQPILEQLKKNKEPFCKINGMDEVYRLLTEERFVVFPLKKICDDSRASFLPIRKKYLLPDYD